jgi:hypothetical protein
MPEEIKLADWEEDALRKAEMRRDLRARKEAEKAKKDHVAPATKSHHDADPQPDGREFV